eukprot:jgi/Bigna1/48318/estExt_Genewise1.C_250103
MEFWNQASKDIEFFEQPAKVLDDSNPPFYKWFPGGKLNASFNCLDVHVNRGRGDDTALIYDSPVSNTACTYSFRELRDEVARAAGMLKDIGVQHGDRVVIYMPMIPEAVIAMLACARLGAIHSVVFGGFAPKELAVRINDASPKVVLSASCGIEGSRIVEYKPLLDEAIKISSSPPEKCIIKQRPQGECDLIQGRDYDWHELMSTVSPADPVPVDSNDPLYILYTSGSTGQPKGVVRDTGGYCVALRWSMEHLMETRPGEVYWAASDVGWVVGHSYIVYGPLLNGSASVLYEGKPVGTPDAGAFWRIAEQYNVRNMFTAPTALRAIRKEDPHGKESKKYDLSHISSLFVAGERCDPSTSMHFADLLGVRVVDNWWQTETGWCICGLQDDDIGTRPGSASLPLPGYDVTVLNDKGEKLENGTEGHLALKLPLPPGAFSGLYNDEKRYLNYFEEFPGYYSTGDAGVIDLDGYVTILERTDDVINVAAHRLSSGQIEAVIKAHPSVNDAAVIGASDPIKGQVPVAFVVLSDDPFDGGKGTAGYSIEEILAEIRQKVRSEVGPIATLKELIHVDVLPKTRSGKVLRKNIRGIVDGVDIPIPGTIEDMAAIDVIQHAVNKMRS